MTQKELAEAVLKLPPLAQECLVESERLERERIQGIISEVRKRSASASVGYTGSVPISGEVRACDEIWSKAWPKIH